MPYLSSKRGYLVAAVFLVAASYFIVRIQSSTLPTPKNQQLTQQSKQAVRKDASASSDGELLIERGSQQSTPSNEAVAIPQNESALDKSIREALSSNSGTLALTLLAPAANDAYVTQHIGMIDATCRGAHRVSSTQVAPSTVDAMTQETLKNFLETYCGDVSALTELRKAITGKYSTWNVSKREQFIDDLFASKHSDSTANAIINEILASPDLRQSVYTAQRLSHLTSDSGPLASWRRILPSRISPDDLNRVFLIAGEILNCPRLGGCGANQFYLAAECIKTSAFCTPGEDLLTYRRRTTSPMLYRAAELIALEMQTRRYR